MNPYVPMQLFLLAGQSNMAGRGKVADLTAAELAADPRILALNREGQWQPAVDPIHWDKPEAGVGLAKFFARIVLEQTPDARIGLIPTACGGSPISKWLPGEYWDQTHSHPWDDAIARTRFSLKSGVLKAILWHQGESDANETDVGFYEQRLSDLIVRFRHELAMPELPFIMGAVGDFDEEGRYWTESHHELLRAQQAVADKVPNVILASTNSKRLRSIGDRMHFNTEAQRVLAQRYAAAYLSLAAQR